MRMRLLSTVLLLAVISATSIPAVPMDLGEAVALFATAGDLMIAYSEDGRQQLEGVIDALRSALNVTVSLDETNEDAVLAHAVLPDQKDLVNKLSQAYYTLGDVFLRADAAAAKTLFIRGQRWGFKSLMMNPQFVIDHTRHGFLDAVARETDVAALYWTYGNWARRDEFDPLGAIVRDDPPKLVALIERALEVDETYIAYGPYRALAAFWGGLPAVPLIAWGKNLPRALSYICPVIEEPTSCTDCVDCPLDPDHAAYFENRLIFAQYYLMEKHLWEDASRVLQSVLDDPIGETYPLYNALCQALAAELLEEVNEEL